MARSYTKQMAVTTTEDSLLLGVGITSVLLKNDGPDDVYIGMNEAVDTSSSYLLDAGEALQLDISLTRIYFKAKAGTATVYVIKNIQ